MNNHQYLFYFTKDYQECYEEWENGKLIHSKVTALGTAMFELLSFCQSDELISYALQALSALSKNETAELLGLNKYEMSLSVTYGIRNGYLAEMLRPKDATDIIFYTLCRASLLKQSKNLCVSVCRRCGQYFFSVKYGRSVKYCNHVNETGYTCKQEAEMAGFGKTITEKEKKIRKLYLRAYHAQRRRWDKAEITKEQLDIWSANGRMQRDCCQRGEICEQAFAEWLENSKDSFLPTEE